MQTDSTVSTAPPATTIAILPSGLIDLTIDGQQVRGPNGEGLTFAEAERELDRAENEGRWQHD